MEIYLSSTDSKYIALSQVLCKNISIIEIFKETKVLGYDVGTYSPTVLCKLFEDNIRYMTLGRNLSIKTREKHINVKCHHFCAYFANSTISIIIIESDKKPSDMLMHQ